MDKIVRDYEIQTDHLIPSRWPDPGKVNKKKRTCRIVDHADLADHRLKLKEIEKKDKYLDLARELTKTMEHESESDINSNWHAWYSHLRSFNGAGRLENNKTRGDQPNDNIIKIRLNT